MKNTTKDTPAPDTTAATATAAPALVAPRLVTTPLLAFSSPEEHAAQNQAAIAILADPDTRAAIWARIKQELLTTGAVLEVRTRQRLANEQAAAAAAEAQRQATFASARSFWSGANVATFGGAIAFFMAPRLSWQLCAMRISPDGDLLPVSKTNRDGRGIVGPAGGGMDSLVRHFEDAGADVLGVDVGASGICLLRGTPEDLDTMATRFSVSRTLAWKDADGIECRAFARFGGCYTGKLWRSVEIVADDVLTIPPSTGTAWTVAPAAFGAGMEAEQTGLPQLPADFKVLLVDLAGAGRREQFIAAMIEK